MKPQNETQTATLASAKTDNKNQVCVQDSLLSDDNFKAVALRLRTKSQSYIAHNVAFGILLEAKKVQLDGQGKKGDGFKAWANKTLPSITTRSLRVYMRIARNFIARVEEKAMINSIIERGDKEAAVALATNKLNETFALLMNPENWDRDDIIAPICEWIDGRSMNEICDDISRAQKEVLKEEMAERLASQPEAESAGEDKREQRDTPESEADRASRILLNIDRSLQFSVQRDREVRELMSKAIMAAPKERIAEHLLALKTHHASLAEDYSKLYDAANAPIDV